MKRHALALSILLTFPLSSLSQDLSGFSEEMLEQLGIDPSILENLGTDEELKGSIILPVYINGDKLDNMELEFIDNKNFYITKEFLEKTDLIDEMTENEKVSFKEMYPEATVQYKEESIQLFVPDSYFNQDPIPEQIGRGGFVNYNLDYDKELSNDDVEAEDVLSATIDYGLNFDGYLYRAGIDYDNFNDDFDFSYNYIQKNFFSRKTLGRAGDMFLLNPHHSSVDVLGIQYASDSNFLSSSVARVEGNVSIQTRVEIYVNETIKIYQTTVQQGYYELTDVTLPFSTNILKIVERGVDGSYNEREVFVQQTEFTLGDDVEFGLTAGVANKYVVDNNDDDEDDESVSSEYEDWILSGYSDLYKTEMNRLQGSFLFGDKYYFGAAGYTHSQLDFYGLSSFNVETGFSYSDDEIKEREGSGMYVSSGLNFNLESERGLNIFGRYETEDFRYIDTLASDLEGQYSISAYSNVPFFDSGSLSYNKSFYYDESPIGVVNLNLQKFYADDSYFSIDAFYDTEDEWNINLFVSIPTPEYKYVDYVDFGYLRDRDEEQLEASLSGNTSGYDYSARASYFVEEETTTLAGTVSKDYRDVYASAGVFLNEDGFENAFVSVEGGFAFSSDGYYDFTSEKIEDTFAFIEIDDLDGVEIETLGSNVVTDDGVAVIPSVDPFVNNQITVVTKTLPENVTISNGLQEINLPFGSIGKLIIPTKPFYQSLIQLVDESNNPISRTHLVTDLNDNFITTVGFDGLVFFEVETKDNKFKARTETTECIFDLTKATESKIDSTIKVIVCK